MPKILSRELDDDGCKDALPIPGRDNRLVDGQGLQLVVRPNGKKLWQLRLQTGRGDRTIPLGTYPAMSLNKARKEAEKARVAAREAPPPPSSQDAGPTFQQAFEDWMRMKAGELSPAYASDVRERLGRNALPTLGPLRLREITRKQVRELVKEIIDRGRHEQARRVRALLSSLFEWAIAEELLTENPAPVGVMTALPRKPKVKHHAAAKFADMPAIMKTFAAYPSVFTSAALRFLVLTAARTGEVREARWDEIDLDAAVWTVPAERMKGGARHRVPLSGAAVAVLNEVPRLSGCPWIFPTPRGNRPMSSNALLYACQGMFPGITVHGFRSTFSTWSNESRAAEPDVIEAALAHVVPGVRGAYDRGDRFDARRALMETWAVAVAA